MIRASIILRIVLAVTMAASTSPRCCCAQAATTSGVAVPGADCPDGRVTRNSQRSRHTCCPGNAISEAGGSNCRPPGPKGSNLDCPCKSNGADLDILGRADLRNPDGRFFSGIALALPAEPFVPLQNPNLDHHIETRIGHHFSGDTLRALNCLLTT